MTGHILFAKQVSSRKSFAGTALSFRLIRLTRYFDRFLQLTPSQCETLVEAHHIYLPNTGRINISGLNGSNIERVAKAIHLVVGAQDDEKDRSSFGIPKQVNGFGRIGKPLEASVASVA